MQNFNKSTGTERRAGSTYRPYFVPPAEEPEVFVPDPKPVRKGYRKTKVHKGKRSCCPCCNPTGYIQARRQDEKESSR